MNKKINTNGLGINQKAAIEFVQSVGGAANTWKIQLETGIGDAAYLYRLVERGIMKKVDTQALLSPSPIPPGTKPVYGEEIKGGNLTQKERQALDRAKKQNPRAYVFWVIASAAKNTVDNMELNK